MKVFSVDGYFNDDNSEFSNFLIAEYNDTPEGYSDEDIFFYGASEEQLKASIAGKAMFGDFEITNYRIVENGGSNA